MNAELDGLTRILEAAQHLEEVSVRAEDKIVSKGEKLSCLYMAALLEDRGVPAQFVDLSDVVSWSTPAKGVTEVFYKNLAQALAREVEACGDKVPVITGYFGAVPGGIMSSIGRGYTDLCAALVAVGVQAEELREFIPSNVPRSDTDPIFRDLERSRRHLHGRPSQGPYSSPAPLRHAVRGR